MKQRAVVFDLDGTLISTKGYAETNPEKWCWAEWAKYAKQAPVIPDMKELWDGYLLNSTRIILTARPEKYRSITYHSAKQCLNFLPEHDILIMMPNSLAQDDFSEYDVDKVHAEYKKKRLTYLNREYDIRMVYDDKESVCTVARSLGINSMQVGIV